MVFPIELLCYNCQKIVRCICPGHFCCTCKLNVDLTVTYNGQIKSVDICKDVCFLDLIRIDVHRRVLNLIDWHLLHQRCQFGNRIIMRHVIFVGDSYATSCDG